MTPIRVLMVGPTLDKVKGGMTTVVENLFSEWDNDAFPRRYIGSYIDAPPLRNGLYNLRAYIKYLYTLLIFQPHVVHLHFAAKGSYIRKSIFGMTAKFLFGKKVILHAHADSFDRFYGRSPGLLQRYIDFSINTADQLIVLSDSWLPFFTTIYKRGAPLVVYNAVNDPVSASGEAASDDFTVLSLGRLGERKGTFVLLQAVPKILEQVPNARFLLGGDGKIEEVRAILNANEWGSHVELLGWVVGDDKHRLMANATVFTLPSYSEGFPMAVLEAMAYELPIVTTPVGGIPEAIQDGETGLLVEPGSADQLAEAIIRLAQSHELRSYTGRKARERFLTQFEIKSTLQTLYKLYRETVSQ